MTISQAINEIAVAQGGTASTSGTIAGAIDALNDALAGSDQKAAQTIEDAVRLLGQNIGGGSSVTVEALTATENKTYTAPEGKAYSPVTVNVSSGGIQEATITFDATFPSSDYIVFIRAQSDPDYPATTAWRFDTSGWFFNVELMQDIMEEYGSKIYATMLNGSGSFQITDGDNVSVSGNATYDGETHIVTFTGDCTVSVTAIEP